MATEEDIREIILLEENVRLKRVIELRLKDKKGEID